MAQDAGSGHLGSGSFRSPGETSPPLQRMADNQPCCDDQVTLQIFITKEMRELASTLRRQFNQDLHEHLGHLTLLRGMPMPQPIPIANGNAHANAAAVAGDATARTDAGIGTAMGIVMMSFGSLLLALSYQL